MSFVPFSLKVAWSGKSLIGPDPAMQKSRLIFEYSFLVGKVVKIDRNIVLGSMIANLLLQFNDSFQIKTFNKRSYIHHF